MFPSDDAQDLVFAQNHVFLIVDLDFRAGVLAEQHAIARLDLERDHLAVLADASRADRDDAALGRLLAGGVRDDDAALLLFLLLDPLDQDAVVQRPDLHGGTPPRCPG
jgi:hypothetical protein